MKVNIFIPCLIDQFSPGTAENMEKILNKYNIDVYYHPEQTCCGQISYKNGYFDHAQELGEKFIKEMNNGQNVVIPDVSCAVMIKKYYPKLFHNSSLHNELKQVVAKTFEFTDFLFNEAGIQTLNCNFDTSIVIHTCCSSLRDYGKSDTMHKLLKTINGIQINDLPDSETCCGFGNSFSIKHNYVSSSMAHKKLMNAISTNSQYLVSNSYGCIMHLNAYAKKQKLPITPIHIADFIALALNQ